MWGRSLKGDVGEKLQLKVNAVHTTVEYLGKHLINL